jgi:hypothetical protein
MKFDSNESLRLVQDPGNILPMKKKSRNIPIGVVLCNVCLSSAGHAIAAVLTEIRMGRHDDFSRIVFEFKDDVQYQLAPDNGSSHISIIFDGATSNIPAPVIKENSICIDNLAIAQQENNLTVDIAVSTAHFRLNPFTIKNPFRMVLDITCLKEADAVPARSQPEPEQIVPAPAQGIVFSNNPLKKQEPDIAMKTVISAPADLRPLPADETAVFQNYLIVILAVLSLIIIALAGIIVFHYWAAPEKSLQDGSAKKLECSEDILSSIDLKIREKLQKIR